MNHNEPESSPFTAVALDLTTTTGAQANGRATNEVAATLVDALTGQYIRNATIIFNITGDALFSNSLQTISADTDNNGVARVYVTNLTTETVTVFAQYDSVSQQAYMYFIPYIPDYSIFTRAYNQSETTTYFEYLVFDYGSLSSAKGRYIIMDVFQNGVFVHTATTNTSGIHRTAWPIAAPTGSQVTITLALRDNPEISSFFIIPTNLL